MPLNENAINDILSWAPEGLEASGDLMPLEEYKDLSARVRGFSSGIARRAVFNRVHRQSAHMAAGLAQFIANRFPPGVRDDADPDKVEEGLWVAIMDMILENSFDLGPEGTIPTVRDGKLVWVDRHAAFLDYFLGWYVFAGGMHPDPSVGMEPTDGSWIDNADEIYPEAWAFLQSPRGQQLCVTLATYDAMNTAVYHTNADGTQIGWGGVGGVPRYCPDIANRRLRLPDLRGMYIEGAGFDLLDVGGCHGDMIRNIVGRIITNSANKDGQGALFADENYDGGYSGTGFPHDILKLDAARVVPTGNKVAPRAWGALPCVYLGTPR